jgi:hypothetical protein
MGLLRHAAKRHVVAAPAQVVGHLAGDRSDLLGCPAAPAARRSAARRRGCGPRPAGWPAAGTIRARGGPAALPTQDPAGRLDRVTSAAHVVDKRHDQRLRGSSSPMLLCQASRVRFRWRDGGGNRPSAAASRATDRLDGADLMGKVAALAMLRELVAVPDGNTRRWHHDGRHQPLRPRFRVAIGVGPDARTARREPISTRGDRPLAPSRAGGT